MKERIFLSEDYDLIKIILVRTKSELAIVKHFMEEVYLTAEQIKKKTGLPEPTVYRNLKRLEDGGIIHSVGAVKPTKTHGGPPTKIWKMTGVRKKWQENAI